MVRFCSMLLCRNGEMPEWHIAETSPKAEIAGNRFGTINFKFAAEMPVKHFGFAIARLQGINIYLALPPVGQIRHVGEFNPDVFRSEEHTSELQSLMRISYAVFCLKNKKQNRLNTKAK